MNEKLQKVLEDILKNEERTKEFSKLKTIEEVYSYFENEVPGLSEDEFEQFIVDIMDGFEENAGAMQYVDAASLESVAGGKNNLARFGAGALALLTFLPVIGANSASAKGLPAGGNVSAVKVEPKKSKETIKKQENKEPKQIFMAKEKKTPIKEKYSEIKKWLKRLGIGAAITIATIFAAKKTGVLDKIKTKIDNAKKEREKAKILNALRNETERLKKQRNSMQEAMKAGLDKVLGEQERNGTWGKTTAEDKEKSEVTEEKLATLITEEEIAALKNGRKKVEKKETKERKKINRKHEKTKAELERLQEEERKKDAKREAEIKARLEEEKKAKETRRLTINDPLAGTILDASKLAHATEVKPDHPMVTAGFLERKDLSDPSVQATLKRQISYIKSQLGNYDLNNDEYKFRDPWDENPMEMETDGIPGKDLLKKLNSFMDRHKDVFSKSDKFVLKS